MMMLVADHTEPEMATDEHVAIAGPGLKNRRNPEPVVGGAG
jgi:hypothetical protein